MTEIANELPASPVSTEQVISEPISTETSSNDHSQTLGEAQKKVKALVIDTNAIVHGMSLNGIAEEYYTCQEVITEVRSHHSREFLTRLPFEIKIKVPTEESIKAVIDFSKKTGDYASLSIPDIKIIALTHTLEIQENGREHIRKEPLKTRPTGSLPSAPPPPVPVKISAEQNTGPDEDGWEQVPSKKSHTKTYKTANRSKSKSKSKSIPVPAEDSGKNSITQQEKDEEEEEEEKDEAEESKTPTTVIETDEQLSKVGLENAVESITSAVSTTTLEGVPDLHESDGDDDDEDAGEWITPENVTEYNAKMLGVTPEALRKPARMSVACTTSDFAMQNVLLQMNLNLVSPAGYRIKKVNNWVLRCHGCYSVTSDSEKKFCPKCGNATLRRVSCSTDSNGNIKYHLKPGFVHNLRGTRYDIPAPKGGRQHNNIVLCEDQREYVKAQRGKKKHKVVDLFDPDFVPLYGKQDTREVGNNMYGTDVVGFGRRNPNATRRRTGKK